MVMCFAFDCKHYSEKHGCRFLVFPKDPIEKKRWILLLGRKDKLPTKHSLVCACHFKDGDRKNGPTIFEHNKMSFDDQPESSDDKIIAYTGQPASVEDRYNPDWTPTQSMGYTTVKIQSQQAVQRHYRSSQRTKFPRLKDPDETEPVAGPSTEPATGLPESIDQEGSSHYDSYLNRKSIKKTICCVPECLSEAEDTTFYHFPRSILLENLWRDALKIPRTQDVGSISVCEQHFDERDFIVGTKKLKKLAIPSFRRNDEKELPMPEKIASTDCSCKCTCGKRQNYRISTELDVIKNFHNYSKPFKDVEIFEEERNQENITVICENARVAIKSESSTLRQKLVDEVKKLLSKHTTVQKQQCLEEIIAEEEKSLPVFSNLKGKLRVKPISKMSERKEVETFKVLTLSDSEEVKGSLITESNNENLEAVSKDNAEIIIIDSNEDNIEKREDNYVNNSEEKAQVVIIAPVQVNSQALINRVNKLTDLFGTKCPFCGFNERNLQNLVSHIRRLHYGLFSQRDITVGDVYRELIKEMEKLQKEEEEFPIYHLNNYYKIYCQYCGELFPNAEGLIAHVKEIHDTLCGPQTLTDNQLKKGMRNCKFCNQIMNNSEEYNAHVAICTSNPAYKAVREKFQICDYCGQTIGIYHIKQHISNVHGGKKKSSLVCEICGLTLASMDSYRYHMLRHEKKRQLKCSVEGCNKLFNTPVSLHRHKKAVHEPEKWKFSCNKCDKRFPVKRSLLLHEKSHSADSHKCGQCGKTFKGMYLLHSHIKRIHTNIKRLKCWVAEGDENKDLEENGLRMFKRVRKSIGFEIKNEDSETEEEIFDETEASTSQEIENSTDSNEDVSECSTNFDFSEDEINYR